MEQHKTSRLFFCAQSFRLIYQYHQKSNAFEIHLAHSKINLKRVIFPRRSFTSRKFSPSICSHCHSHSQPLQARKYYAMKLTSRLSRSAIDATRFTATSPHAYSKPTPSLRSAPVSSSTTASRANPQARRPPHPSTNAPKQQPLRSPLPPGGNGAGTETPAEKVARLRAQRMAEREAQVSQWDKVVVRGRSWADRAHKVTVYFLVTFSGTSHLPLFSDFPSIYLPPTLLTSSQRPQSSQRP